MQESRRSRYEVLRAQLANERSSFEPHWAELSQFLLPRRSRFFVQDRNRGDRRNQKIIDSTGTKAVRSLRAGMMSGITSPARPWFRLTTPDPDLAEYGAVKQWLHDTTERMSAGFLKSNLYNILPLLYGDLGTFGTSPMSIEEDFYDPFRFYSYPVGSYYIANDERMQVRVFMREFQMTVRNLVNKFGRDTPSGAPDWSLFSDHVKNMYDKGQYEEWISVVHLIQPNEEYDQKKLPAKYKRFKSCYYESGQIAGSAQSYLDSNSDVFLRESGFDDFPILCPRWEITGEDVYGTDCPGMTVLGDVKQLQLGERRAAQAIDKMVNPPLIAPSSLINKHVSVLPGGVTYEDTREGQRGLRPIHEVQPRILELEQKQQQVRERIRGGFFEDLFLMISQSDRRDITAREIEERHEEKLLALGPVLEQVEQDLLNPLIDNAFNLLVKRGDIPPAPKELQGIPLRVEFVSIMAQAQKLVGLSGIERFSGFANNLAAVAPAALDKVNVDQLLDVYSDILSIPPGIVRTDDEVKEIRDQRAKAQQAQQTAEMAQQGSMAAKNLSQSDLGGDSALKRILEGAGA